MSAPALRSMVVYCDETHAVARPSASATMLMRFTSYRIGCSTSSAAASALFHAAWLPGEKSISIATISSLCRRIASLDGEMSNFTWLSC